MLWSVSFVWQDKEGCSGTLWGQSPKQEYNSVMRKFV